MIWKWEEVYDDKAISEPDKVIDGSLHKMKTVLYWIRPETVEGCEAEVLNLYSVRHEESNGHQK